jgi:hypothetical protein
VHYAAANVNPEALEFLISKKVEINNSILELFNFINYRGSKGHHSLNDCMQARKNLKCRVDSQGIIKV